MKKGISPVISALILFAVGLAISLAVIAWSTGIMGGAGYGTRPILMGIHDTMHGSGSIFMTYIRNFGGDTVFIDQIIIDGKYTATITAAYETTLKEKRLSYDEYGNAIVMLKPGDEVTVLFTLELPKNEIRRLFSTGTHHEVKIHLSLGYEYQSVVSCYYTPHGSWTIRQSEEAGDGWILQGGHEKWGALTGTLHMYILRYKQIINGNFNITVKARWLQGSGQLMIVFGYDGKGNGYAIWTRAYSTNTPHTKIVHFREYGFYIEPLNGTAPSFNSNEWFWMKINVNQKGNKIDVKAKVWQENFTSEPTQWQIQIDDISSYGPYIGLGYWEEPLGGEQSVYQFDCLYIEKETFNIILEFNDVSELERNWIEEG